MSKILGIHTPYEVKNLAINGGFDFWQEKVGTTTTVNASGSNSTFISDMFRAASGGTTTLNYSVVRSTDVPTFSQAGFDASYSAQYTHITATPSFASTDFVIPLQYRMEGLDYANIHGKTVTFGFWMKASVPGTYSFAVRNDTLTRSYVTTFQVITSNNWEFKSITVPMDTQGTWNFDNSIGALIEVGTLAGSSTQTSTLSQWQSGNFRSSSISTNYAATAGAVIRVAMFSIVEGSLGFGQVGFQRAGKSIQQELAMAQRYYQKFSAHISNTGSFPSNNIFSKVTMRDTPIGSVTAGSISQITADWLIVSHNAQATVTVTLDARL